VDALSESIDARIQAGLDKLIDEQGGVTYVPKPLNEQADIREMTGNIDMNGFNFSDLADATSAQ
jgi:hypothetical protein